MPRSFNKALKILLVTDGFILLAGAMLGPIYALFVQKIGGDLLDASYAFAAFAVAQGLATFISGKQTDAIKENELIVALGYGVMGLGYLGYLFVYSIWSLLLVQVIIGLGSAIYFPAFDAIYSKHLDGHKSGSQWGAWEMVNNFTSALGAVAGGVLVTRFGFSTIFVIMASLCFVSGLYIVRLPRRTL